MEPALSIATMHFYSEEEFDEIRYICTLTVLSHGSSLPTFVSHCLARDVAATSIICERLKGSMSPGMMSQSKH